MVTSVSLTHFLQQPPRQYTPKERDMVLKNTEMSFRVRQLEEKNAELERFKTELVRYVRRISSTIREYNCVCF